jgi:tRNA 2-selenouridine synthase
VYASYPKEDLAKALGKIKKRLGLDRYATALEALDNGNFSLVAEITLHYYDKAYMYGLELRDEAQITRIEVRTLDPIEQTEILLQHAT